MATEAAKIRPAAKKSRREPEAPPAGIPARAGRAIKAGWLRFAAVLAKVNGAILLTLIYFLVIAPINLLSRVVRADLLGRHIGEDPSFWKDPEGPALNLQDSRKQF